MNQFDPILSTHSIPQHSGARVGGQWVYRRGHFGDALAGRLVESYYALMTGGWPAMVGDVGREVQASSHDNAEEGIS